ncbi:hypothetical protein GT037_005525 [Alternaria burnsii]|uniref:Uncharacterized protein n=1 Tax=Alternaria burnsii TaxID=1187904 RepID=A0A8H7BB25_9PLEO|nr:uncharacterized protein GT037_005525 [Alternaria burnsii]KAF7676020.1 hypothetical protein GT037_005525 [Alternaria burnsii]
MIHDSLPPTPNQTRNKWSRQDIFTLVSVCVAIVGIFIGVIVASPEIARCEYDAEGYGSKNSKTKLEDEC